MNYMSYHNKIYKGTPRLFERLKEAGIVNYKTLENFRSQWIKPLEDKGKLSIPRHPNNKRVRLLTEDQISAIIVAFSPGGRGFWRYKGDGVEEGFPLKKTYETDK